MKRLINSIRRGLGSDNRGAALITALIFLAILTALGMASIMTSSTELMVSRNYRLNMLALDYANAGVQVALARLDAGDIGTTKRAIEVTDVSVPSKLTKWDTTSSGMGLTDISFTSTTEFLLEDEVNGIYYRDKYPDPDVGDPSDHEVVGYSKNCGYTRSIVIDYEKAYPVYRITSIGRVMSGGRVIATATVESDVTKNMLLVGVQGALSSKNCVNQGSNTWIKGAGDCGGADMPPVVTDCATSGNPAKQTGAPPITGPGSVDAFEETFGVTKADLIAQADNRIDPPNCNNHDPTFGSTEANPKIVYVNCPNYIMSANTVGYGILIVDGDLTTVGTANWNGVVYTEGDLHLGGTYQFIGSVVVNGANGTDTDLLGTGDITYSKCQIDNLINTFAKSRSINWQRKYNF